MERSHAVQVERLKGSREAAGEIKMKDRFECRGKELEVLFRTVLHHSASEYPSLPCAPRLEPASDSLDVVLCDEVMAAGLER